MNPASQQRADHERARQWYEATVARRSNAQQQRDHVVAQQQYQPVHDAAAAIRRGNVIPAAVAAAHQRDRANARSYYEGLLRRQNHRQENPSQRTAHPNAVHRSMAGARHHAAENVNKKAPTEGGGMLVWTAAMAFTIFVASYYYFFEHTLMAPFME